MAKRHWYTGLRGACKVPRSLLGWWYEIAPSAFLGRYAVDPDRYCTDCAKAARLALAKESAPKPTIHNKAGACVVRPELGQLVRERPNCGEKRTDSARYNELRKLVEAWQSHTVESSQSLADWRHR